MLLLLLVVVVVEGLADAAMERSCRGKALRGSSMAP
jgi:hypothetical protein